MEYHDSLKIVRATVGQRRVDGVTGKDVRRWFKEWDRFDPATGPLANPRRACRCIQQLRVIVDFGVEMKDRACMDLKAVL